MPLWIPTHCDHTRSCLWTEWRLHPARLPRSRIKDYQRSCSTMACYVTSTTGLLPSLETDILDGAHSSPTQVISGHSIWATTLPRLHQCHVRGHQLNCKTHCWWFPFIRDYLKQRRPVHTPRGSLQAERMGAEVEDALHYPLTKVRCYGLPTRKLLLSTTTVQTVKQAKCIDVTISSDLKSPGTNTLTTWRKQQTETKHHR